MILLMILSLAGYYCLFKKIFVSKPYVGVEFPFAVSAIVIVLYIFALFLHLAWAAQGVFYLGIIFFMV